MKSFRWSHVISYLIMVIVLVFFAFVPLSGHHARCSFRFQ